MNFPTYIASLATLQRGWVAAGVIDRLVPRPPGD